VLPDTSSSNTIAIKVTALPVANAGKDVSVCSGGSVMLNASGGNNYSWSPAFSLSNAAIANPISNPLTTTTYILTVTNGDNCSSKDSVIVTVNQLVSPVININSSSDHICFGNVTTFTADVKNEGTNPIYQWQVNGINTGDNGKLFTTATFNDGDQVRGILTSNASCITKGNDTSRVIKMTVEKLDEPIVSLHSKILTVENPDAAAAYAWQLYSGNAWNNVVPAATGISFNVPANGEYRVMADKNPCLVYSKSNVAILRTSQTINPYGINLYPNPGSKIITLDSIQLSQNWETLDIVTADGQRVFPSEHIKNKTTVSLDISGLRKGTYFVQLRRLIGKVTSIRFVKL
jgi:Secretion system C-terminal sorting domain